MDSLDASRKIPKLRSVTGAISPIDTRLADSSLMRYLCGGGSPITSSFGYRTGNDEFSSSSMSSNSSRGGTGGSRRSLTPMSDIANLISPGTPVKLVDEDVLVMDGILVSGARVSKSLSSDSSGSSSNSGSSGGNRRNKMELCRFWEDNGECRAGYRCQFAHGKEELRPSFISMKNNKSEFAHGKEELRLSFNSMKNNKSETHSPKSYPPKSRFLSPSSAFAMPFKPESECKSQTQNSALNSNKNYAQMCLSKSPTFIKPEMSKKIPITNTTSRDWLLWNDGIEESPPKRPGRPRKSLNQSAELQTGGSSSQPTPSPNPAFDGLRTVQTQPPTRGRGRGRPRRIAHFVNGDKESGAN